MAARRFEPSHLFSKYLRAALQRVRFGTLGLNSSRVCLMCKILVIVLRFLGSRMHDSGVALTCGSIYRLWAFPNRYVPAFGKSGRSRRHAAMGAGSRRAVGSCPLTFLHQRQCRFQPEPTRPYSSLANELGRLENCSTGVVQPARSFAKGRAEDVCNYR